MQPHWNTVNIRCHLEVGVEAIVLFSLKRCWARDNTSDVNKIALSPLLVEGRTGGSRSRWWYETVMVRGGTMGEFFVLLVTLPVTMANSFVGSPGVVSGDVTASAALEWTLQSEPGRDDLVVFTFNGDNVFRYEPYTGVIPPPVLEGPGGPPTNSSYDPRFTIYNTSTRGVGFRVARLRPEDAGTYTCRYETLSAPITMDAVLFVYDVPGKPGIEASPQTLVEGVTNVSLECGTSSTSLPVAYRPAMLYTWSVNGVDIERTGPPERHAVLGDSGQTLAISPVHHTDTTYTCTASENGTQLTSKETEVTLDVLHGPYILTINPRNPSARQDESLEITASTDCNPACSFTWSIGDDVIIHDPILSFDRFQVRDTNNYTVIAANLYGTADLTVEVTLDTSQGQHTVLDDFIVVVASAAAGGLLLLIIIIVVAVCCARHRRNPASEYVKSEVLGEPGHSTSDYINPDVFRELGQPTGDYMTIDVSREPGQPTGDYLTTDVFREPGQPTGDYITTDVFREPGHPTGDYITTDVFREPGQATGDYLTTDVFREPGQPTGDYVNSEICRKPSSAGHPHADASGHYESMDMATREPADPINRVYEALQQ